MADTVPQKLAQCISCHAWNHDYTMLAICPNNSEVHIYNAASRQGAWTKEHVLKKHDQLVAGVSWGPHSNRIVTCSHDRNAYVWHWDGHEWAAALVILRLNRAALAVEWSPKENKFAVASGAKSLCVCHYEEENNWWVSKLIKKKHSSSVTSVSWHPNNVLVATTSTDGKCRVFSAAVKGVDSKKEATTAFGENKFGEQLLQLDLACGWTFGASWSPSGDTLAFVGHDATIHFAAGLGAPPPATQSLHLKHLPLRDVLFLSETELVAAGFDCDVLLFVRDPRSGLWAFERGLDDPKEVLSSPLLASASASSPAGAAHSPSSPLASAGPQFLEAFGRFDGQIRKGQQSNGLEPWSRQLTAHQNAITMIRPMGDAREGPIRRFSTSGLDGRVVTWDLSGLNLQGALAGLTVGPSASSLPPDGRPPQGPGMV